MYLTSNDITILLLSISVMLFVARGVGELMRLIKQPLVIGEIIAGIILGPTILGLIYPELFHSLFNKSNSVNLVLEGITTISVVMLLLVSGIEVDLAVVLKQKKIALITSIMGIVVPFGLGFLAAYLFPEFFGIRDQSMRLVFALFIGTALSITALPVVARTLMDLNLFKTDIGYLIIASAMVNDLVGWIIFSIILRMVGTTSHAFSFGTTLLFTFGFMIIVLFFGRKLINYIIPFVQRKFSFPGGILNLVLILGFFASAFTEYIGVHAVFGAFIIGIAIGDSAHLQERTKEIIEQFITNIFAPLFFVSIGLRINFINNFDFWIVSILLLLAFAGKVIGCGLGAYWGGMKKEESLVVGFGMNSRGAMQIVLGTLALQVGLIHEKVFVAIVIVAILTSISSAPLMNIFVRRIARKTQFRNLLKPELTIIGDLSDKELIIKRLSNLIETKLKLPVDTISRKILEREASFPSGIANYLAIPHIRADVKDPVLAVYISSQGADFGALDALPSKAVFLLVTPLNENELHLKILADIVNEFKELKQAEQLISVNETSDLIKMLKGSAVS
ncbi:MAG: cation:proton antiporter [Ignavibacteriaceae bacterium]